MRRGEGVVRLPKLRLESLSEISYDLLIEDIEREVSVVEFHISRVTGLKIHTWYTSMSMTTVIDIDSG